MSKKPDWVFRQSGVVPFVKSGNTLKVVLISSSSKKNWIIPKGVIERSMTAEESALKEAIEEAGVTGAIVPGCVAEYEYEKWGGGCNVKVFPMDVSELFNSWEEDTVRDRICVDIDEAERLVKPEIKEALRLVCRFRIGEASSALG